MLFDIYLMNELQQKIQNVKDKELYDIFNLFFNVLHNYTCKSFLQYFGITNHINAIQFIEDHMVSLQIKEDIMKDYHITSEMICNNSDTNDCLEINEYDLIQHLHEIPLETFHWIVNRSKFNTLGKKMVLANRKGMFCKERSDIINKHCCITSINIKLEEMQKRINELNLKIKSIDSFQPNEGYLKNTIIEPTLNDGNSIGNEKSISKKIHWNLNSSSSNFLTNYYSTLSQWCGKKGQPIIIFDSLINNGCSKKLLNDKIHLKQSLYFIHIDNTNNIFGCYMNKGINTNENDWIYDENHFIFTIQMINNLQQINKYTIKPGQKSGIGSLQNNYCLYQFGRPSFGILNIGKVDSNDSYCWSLRNVYSVRSNFDINGTSGKSQTYVIKRLMIIQINE